MSTTPSEPSPDPKVAPDSQPEAQPDAEPSRPHGDPLIPDEVGA